MPRNDGLCECGCGQQTSPAGHNNTKMGYVKGKPMRFARGHNSMKTLRRQEREVTEHTKLVHGAACPTCKSELYFFTDTIFGALFEQCTNARCRNATPHRPQPDPDCGPPRQSEVDRLAKRAELSAKRRIDYSGRPRKGVQGVAS